MRIVLATDAWEPQVNGVARTLATTVRELQRLGHEVNVAHPHLFRRVRCPFTSDVELAWSIGVADVRRMVRPPCAVHISTEGPIGLAFRRYCAARGLPFTTAYHTHFPEYLYEHTGVPVAWTARLLRWFHRPSAGIMVATPSLERTLRQRRFTAPIKLWSRGIDRGLFYPRPKTISSDKPIALFVGRVAKEKNIEAFLLARNAVAKIVVGDGPEKEVLGAKYPAVRFTGTLKGEELAQMYANADVFVFPSRTDTFGLVVIEALASGVPVAAYPVPGPADILGGFSDAGHCDENLEMAIDTALRIGKRQACLDLAARYTWEASTRQFLANLTPIPQPSLARAAS
jgi:glycosyltransferase involved in cell wall biosynthesis